MYVPPVCTSWCNSVTLYQCVLRIYVWHVQIIIILTCCRLTTESGRISNQVIYKQTIYTP